MQATTAFPQCTRANWETEFLLKTGHTALKLQLHCDDQSSCYVLTLNTLNTHAPTDNKSDNTKDNFRAGV